MSHYLRVFNIMGWCIGWCLLVPTAFACEDDFIGRYIERAPAPGMSPATLVFQADGQGIFEYQEGDVTHQEPFRWSHPGPDNITVSYLNEAGEVNWVEHYVCTNDHLVTIVDGRPHVHEKLLE